MSIPRAAFFSSLLGLVGGGIAMIVLGKPDLTASQFTASVVPSRVDLDAYLDPSTRTRGDDFGTYRLLQCRGRTSRAVCPAEVGAVNAVLLENYEVGVTDGQISVVAILDENGFTVNSGPFVPAQYTKETLKDPQAMRLGGAALIAAGAIAALAWPDSAPVESLDVAPLPGGGWLGATVGF